MSKRKQEQKPERFVSKHQLSKWQRQKRMRNITVGGGIAIIVAVVAIVSLGFYNAQVRPYNAPAIRVNNTTFSLRYFINALKMYSGGYPSQTVADQTIQVIEQQELIRQAAAALGVTVDRSTVVAELKAAKQPVTRENIDYRASSDLIDKLHTEYFTSKVAASQPQVQIQAMLLESESAAQQAIDRLKAGESFDALATSLSKESITQSKKGDLGWLAGHEADLLLGDTGVGDLMLAAPSGISGPTYDSNVTKDYGFWVVKVLEKKDASADGKTPQSVHAEGILVASPADAQDVINRLNAGADFATLAAQVSLQSGVKKSSASPDMGWVDYSSSLSNFQKALFDLPVNVVSGPLGDVTQQTPGGYWVFNVLGSDPNRALTSDQTATLAGDLLNQWAAAIPKDPKNKVTVVMSVQQEQFAILKATGTK